EFAGRHSSALNGHTIALRMIWCASSYSTKTALSARSMIVPRPGFRCAQRINDRLHTRHHPGHLPNGLADHVGHESARVLHHIQGVRENTVDPAALTAHSIHNFLCCG